MKESIVPLQTCRQLVDAKLEVRERGTRDVATRAASALRGLPPAEVSELIMREMHEVERTMLRTTAVAYRRGALVAVKTLITFLPVHLQEQAEVEYLVSITFGVISDVDVSVRVAALEAAHTLVRHLKQRLLNHCFLQTFRGVAIGINDNDGRVVVLARELSSAIRELVTGNTLYTLNAELFVEFISEMLTPFCTTVDGSTSVDSHTVEWCLEWIKHVSNLPGDDFIVLLWRILEPLLILSGVYSGTDVLPLLTRCLEDTEDAFKRHKDVPVAKLILITSKCVQDIDIFLTKRQALGWMLRMLELCTWEVVGLVDKIVQASLPQLGSKDLETRLAAQKVNQSVMQCVAAHKNHVDVVVPYDAVLAVVLEQLVGHGTEENCVAALEWVVLLHRADPVVVENSFESTFDTMLDLLCDRSARVVHKCIEALCLISGETHFDHFIAHLVDLLHARAEVLLPTAPTIIKQLQLRFQGDELDRCEKLCLKLALVISEHSDKRFVEKVVITLNTMLLTAREFLPLREILHKGLDDTRARATFLGLYNCWCYNAVASLSLCFLARAYSHAFQLIQLIGSAEVSPNTLLQLERFARLIETPVFSYVRTALMEPSKCLPLVKTLFALHLILPQCSPQYALLYRRIKTIPSLARLESEVHIHEMGISSSHVDWDALMARSREAQESVAEFERKLYIQQLGDVEVP